jgi:hypothetical protein
MRECIEEGILQGYVDDELSPEAAERVAAHLLACAACAREAAEATNETLLLATAFEAENALDIPTVRLRERLDAAIAEMNRPVAIFEQKQGGSTTGWLASLAGLFKVSPQRALGFASLIAVVAFAAIFAVIRWNQAGTNNNEPVLTASDDKKPKVASPATASPSPTPSESDNPTAAPDNNDKKAPRKRTAPKKQADPTLVPEPGQLPKDELAIKLLPGEEHYLKAIDTLKTEIAASAETTMKPSLRAEYERNLAIVDQAIDSTRRVARRNPNDRDASEFLYSSYQSKLDLLSAVAEQVRPTLATR